MYFKDQNGVTYPQLVLRQIQKIQDICQKELKGGDKIFKNLLGEQIVESEDSRQAYLQSIDLLGSLLSPYFTPKTTTKFDKFVELYQMELKSALKDDEFKKEVTDYFDLDTKNTAELLKDDKTLQEFNLYLLNFKIKNARIMFRQLIQCFKENDFLAQETYGEGDSSGGNDDMLDASDEE